MFNAPDNYNSRFNECRYCGKRYHDEDGYCPHCDGDDDNYKRDPWGYNWDPEAENWDPSCEDEVETPCEDDGEGEGEA